MIDLLRSLTWGQSTEEQLALSNLTKVRVDRLLALKAPEQVLLTWILDFHLKYTKAPGIKVLRDFADDLKDPKVTELVDNVELGAFYSGTDFEALFEREVKSQGVTELTAVCKEAISLVTSGKKSLEDAVGHIFSSLKVPPSKDGDKTPSGMRAAIPALKKIYEYRKASPLHSYGIMTGYGFIDQATAGIKKKQLRIHAAFPGHLKSTVAMNEIVNAAELGWNPILFETEMPADDVMLKLAAIHSANRKFNGVNKPISAYRLLLGKLEPADEKFLDLVMDDLVNNPDHGHITVVDSGEFSTLGSIVQRVTREHAEREVDLVWIDYLTRLPVDSKYQKMQLTEARNETIADAKRFAMSFDGGRGVAVCTAFQTNRESYKRVKQSFEDAGAAVKPGQPAKKAGGYDMTCLGQYNAAEKEADVITYTWYDTPERQLNEPKLGILKSRWGDVSSDLATLFIERDSRRIFDMTSGMRVSSAPTQSQSGGGTDVEI